MEIFKDPKVEWLKYKWVFIGLSTVLASCGALSLLVHGLNLGVDFSGGTLVYVKFKETPDLERIRSVLRGGDLNAEEVTRFDEPELNQVQIRMSSIGEDVSGELTQQSARVLEKLHAEFDREFVGGTKWDFNNINRSELAMRLADANLEGLDGSEDVEALPEDHEALAARIIDFRSQRGGVIHSLEELEEAGLSQSLRDWASENFYLGSFNLISVESVGPKVGRELMDRASSAVLFSLIGMLIYIAWRFRTIYGIAAIAALFHDVFITLGFFSLFNKEISLTVVAALLTLVGYSINDTIVVFDRVRENRRLARREDLGSIINRSINQTLNRTVLTSGGTFLAVMALYLRGGQVLNGFSFALVVGIIIGTYSSVAIASPIVLWWQNFTERRKARI